MTTMKIQTVIAVVSIIKRVDSSLSTSKRGPTIGCQIGPNSSSNSSQKRGKISLDSEPMFNNTNSILTELNNSDTPNPTTSDFSVSTLTGGVIKFHRSSIEYNI